MHKKPLEGSSARAAMASVDALVYVHGPGVL